MRKCLNKCFILVIRDGVVNFYEVKQFPGCFDRVLLAFLADVDQLPSPNFDLWASGQRPQNFYMLGSMGLAPSIALGVALAQPDRKVFCLEGDGSILMHLGSLATIALMAPRNLAIVIVDNGIYQITGGQKTHTSHGTDLVAIAAGAGLAKAQWARDESHFEAWVDRALAEDGPWLIGVRTDDSPPAGVTDRDPVRIRERFMQGLGVRP